MSYPTGPLLCEDDPDCNPLITTFTEPICIFIYCLVSLVFLCNVGFFIFRFIKSGQKVGTAENRDRRKSVLQASSIFTAGFEDKPDSKSRDIDMENLANVYETSSPSISPKNEKKARLLSAVNTQNSNEMRLQGYRKNTFGFICWVNTIGFSALLVILIIIVLIDFYYDCQLEGIDNLCYFGSHPIYGNFDRNSVVFFWLWLVSNIWFAICLTYKNELENWFRVPCHINHADFVWIWVRDEEELMVPNPFKIVKIYRKVRAFLFRSEENKGHANTVPVIDFQTSRNTTIRYFMHEGTRYVLNQEGHFEPPTIYIGSTYADLHGLRDGVDSRQAEERLDYLGENEIPFVPDSVLSLIKGEFFTWFYLYQWIMYIVWFWFSYMFVAAIETCVILASASVNIFVTWMNEKQVAKLSDCHSSIQVLRDGAWATLDSRKLVPGDIVSVRNDWRVPCDMVLLDGTAVCNESALTGESTPVQKTTCPNEEKEYDSLKAGSRHTLFAGTTVLQAQSPHEGDDAIIVAVVTATGIDTSKGELVSTILYPQKMLFKYDEELDIVVMILLCYGIVVFTLAIIFQTNSGISGNWVTKWAYGVFTVSQILTPLLPVALKVGQIRSLSRLKEMDILTVNPARIAISGKVRVFCFDKTGTLTRDGLDFLGVQPKISGPNGLEFSQSLKLPVDENSFDQVVMRCLASCHSLSMFGATFVGNEVEVKMFQSTKWSIQAKMSPDPNNTGKYLSGVRSPGRDEMTLIKRFEFDHARQTMSVLMQDNEGNYHVFCKGSFEKIKSACQSSSLPSSYSETAVGHAMDGGYTLSIAHKPFNLSCNPSDIQRDDLECDLDFLGLIVFRNELKEDTADAIAKLREGNVHSLIITGDNAQCANYIARSCGMIDENETTTPLILGELSTSREEVVWNYMGRSKKDKESMTTQELINQFNFSATEFPKNADVELAITGNNTLDALMDSGHLQYLIHYIRVFARMSPDSKVAVVSQLRSMGKIVGMCGDGGNDCGALRAAHVGIALSDAEASIVSPFTSKTKTCTSVVDLVREGRAALHTSFGVYKFLIIYGQLFSIVKLVSFYFGVLMSLMSYIFVDAVAVLTLGYTMTLGRPKDSLKSKRPTSSLLGPQTLSSVLGVQFINMSVMVINLLIVTNHEDYVAWPSKLANSKHWWYLSDNWESTTLYYSFYFVFISTAVVFSFGSHFRSFVLTNFWLVINWAILFIMTLLLVFLSPNSFTKVWHIASEPFNRENPPNPTWQAWQDAGNDTSNGMSIALRTELFIVVMIGLCLICIWQSIFAEGPIAARVSKRYYKNRNIHNK